jgi:hypothetical protein
MVFRLLVRYKIVALTGLIALVLVGLILRHAMLIAAILLEGQIVALMARSLNQQLLKHELMFIQLGL